MPCLWHQALLAIHKGSGQACTPLKTQLSVRASHLYPMHHGDDIYYRHLGAKAYRRLSSRLRMLQGSFLPSLVHQHADWWQSYSFIQLRHQRCLLTSPLNCHSSIAAYDLVHQTQKTYSLKIVHAARVWSASLQTDLTQSLHAMNLAACSCCFSVRAQFVSGVCRSQEMQLEYHF